MGITPRRFHPHHFSRGTNSGVQALLRNLLQTTDTSTKAPTPANTASPTSFMWMAIGPGDALSGLRTPDRNRRTKRIISSSSRPWQEQLLKPLRRASRTSSGPETRRNEVHRVRAAAGCAISPSAARRFRGAFPCRTIPKHVIYVWLDALANYITALGYGSEATRASYDQYWPADVHMIGKEIVRFHCVYWPAFLLAAGLPLPKCIVAHGWLLFEESKMSKSRGNIVRSETILDVLGADALRYFLLREIVFGQDGSFSFDALVQRFNADLANGLGNLASRTLTMITRYFEGEVPYPSARPRTRRRMPPSPQTASESDRRFQHAL